MDNKKGRILGILLLAVMLVFGLAACGGGSGKGGNASDGSRQSEGDGGGSGNTGASDDSGSGNTGGKQVTLDFVWFTDGIEGEVMKAIIKDYEAENPNVKINLVEVAYSDLSTKLRTMIAGGRPPALARVTDTGYYKNQALPLDDYIGDQEAFTSQFMDSIKPYYVMDGKVIAVPMDVTANGLIYNKTLFDKAGVQVPQSPDEVWTWDEFKDALKQVMEKGGAKFGLVWDFTPHRYSTLLYQFGGSIFNADGTAAAINDDAGVKALEYFVQLHKDGIIPESVWLGGENPNNLFRTGTVAAHLAGNWMLSNYREITEFEWGVTYMPKAERRSSVPGGKYVMAFKGSGVEDEAAKFLLYLSSKEVNGRYCQESLFISPRKDNAQLDYAFGKEMFEIFSNELANTPAEAANDWSRQELITQFTTDMRNQIVEAVAGNMTPQKAMDQLAALINAIIANTN
ncbi:MAG: sugar ABC transporter substrate-binding protein [Thermobacillus sp. ZCTH02-B1]|mgnify:CR=1 FL=1|uniref:ABC transporter substrate-binding protein n=1 Tax=Thermobacillus sp. ZCTH02-B1 TaxID=1858795 RepID=UPI000B57BA70|nr:sugar ABC transporter substrate-binding protein [Thermobacillus sp. ZCTH02-B1]OUM95628.1 MAG: sugar ABC transporter substrate-binding protein [Thermobacillus sp. ZCTH02-B1]